MNDNDFPGPPPDDFSKTTPNIKLPEDVGGTQNDWEKTNLNFPKQPVADDWGKTVANIRPIDIEREDFGKTMFPTGGSTRPQPDADWGVSHPHADKASTDFGSSDFGGGYDKTTPYFRLPEAEREKYQKLPPTPTEQAAQQQKEEEKKGGVPGWVWAVLGGGLMFFFACGLLAIVYFFVLVDKGFKVTVKGAPPGSDVWVDDVPWGVTTEDGSINLQNLKAGRRIVTVTHPTYTCEAREIDGRDGETPEPIIARCTAMAAKPGEDCSNIGLGEEDKAERCYNAALDRLGSPPSLDELIKALNILIINFESGKYDIPPKRLAALQKAATFIKQLPPEVVLEIGGHTDNVGSDASNQVLSDNRAKAVREALVKFGVKPEVLQTRGYGASQPKTENNTEQGRFHNRRIQYSVVRK